MLHKTRVKLTLRALEQHNGIAGTKLMELVGIENSGALKVILKGLERNNYIFTSEDKKLFEEFYSNFEISNEIYVTETGVVFLQDFEDNTKILLETISKKTYSNNSERLLPYLTLSEYREIIYSSIHDGYISAKSNDKVYLETKDGLILSNSVFVTSKGRDYLNNKLKEDQIIANYTINNYGNFAQSSGENSPVNMNIQQNEAFNDLDELLDYLENDVSKKESNVIAGIFKEVVQEPAKKKQFSKRQKMN